MTTLSGILPPVNVSTATGTLPANKGGTGLTSAGAAGNVLTSDGDGWVSSPASGGGGSSVVISETAPASPTAGTVWWDSDTGASYIYYDDGNTAQWVSFSMGETGATGPAGPTGEQGPQGPQGEAGAVTCPQNVQNGNYTLVLADAGKHIYSANTGAQTITIPTNASVAFPIGTLITIVNEGTNRILLSRTGVTIKPNGSDAALSVPAIAPSQSVQLLKTGTNNWKATFGVIIEKPVTLQYLVIAGGGGAKYGGGGAGGYLTGTQDFTLPLTMTVTVGAGGAGAVNGANSVLSGSTTTITAIGGGTGGQYTSQIGNLGGSGGGGSGYSIGGAGTAGQGNAGGAGTYGSYSSGGGGGGAGAAGGNALASGQGGGVGGAGLSSSITGTAITRGGGGGGSTIVGSGGVGGSGGGGSGATSTAGTANTGGGGGAQNNAGGSGVVIIRTSDTPTGTTGSPTITTVGSETVYVFNSSGTITFA